MQKKYFCYQLSTGDGNPRPLEWWPADPPRQGTPILETINAADMLFDYVKALGALTYCYQIASGLDISKNYGGQSVSPPKKVR